MSSGNDQSCRILVVSSSLLQATSFIQSLSAISTNKTSSPFLFETLDLSSTSLTIPWSISNRYYTADVHFAAHTLESVASHHVHGVPAVIFVWADGEPYEQYLDFLSHVIKEAEPEVSLAVRIQRDGVVDVIANGTTKDEENANIDGILMSYGFEYIDATGLIPPQRNTRNVDRDDIEDDSDDIPHLPRVLDALSTIMWTSMTQNKSPGTPEAMKGVKYRGQYSTLEEIINRDPADLIAALEEVTNEPIGLKDKDLVKRNEALLAELRATSDTWQSAGGGDAWQYAASSGHIVSSPTDMETMSPFGVLAESSPNEDRKVSVGFDDDFTVFVSAPAPLETIQEASGLSTPELFHGPSKGLAPVDAGDFYRSLGSVSDFGGSEDERYTELDDSNDFDDPSDLKTPKSKDDDSMPTETEIRETSLRIFGAPVLSRLHMQRVDASTPKAEIADSLTPEQFTSGIDDPYDMESFDLTKVLGALQQFKSEIAGMDNEDERRKAAAKVALGLVYGLEGGIEQ
ncbi:uncharacterized protein LACBIDRAFT_308990 [Laccaria bicolor S238N-H82]|uniref:Predicted protein n=1 Tax=Laccaria bicolor (strain S238N-H82 / ATCC MYA-4686) TaxID=486041 RepID=B0CV95_LACBS|nr:uncharacterized protein LACBIDRAFT_308990 [Laccaria bicolor S238N-H82]EDR13708.1 predicted protein [Laccaria bicolor S238N-H82]|eukprot:XP_001876206.1 predicted protein [Laccaria bicolor S238N-H82]